MWRILRSDFVTEPDLGRRETKERAGPAVSGGRWNGTEGWGHSLIGRRC